MSELTKALCAFHRDVPAIPKAAKAQYGAFADLPTILSTIYPTLTKHGLSFTHTLEPMTVGDQIRDVLVCTLRHTSGEQVESRLVMTVQDGRNALHAWGASHTYLRRHQLLGILGLCADIDCDGDDFVNAPPEPAAKPKVAKTDGKKTVERKGKDLPTLAKAAEKSVEPVDKPIDSDTKAMVMALLRERHSQNATQIEQLSKAFKEKFPDTAKSPLSQAFQTEAHVDFINSFLDNAPA